MSYVGDIVMDWGMRFMIQDLRFRSRLLEGDEYDI